MNILFIKGQQKSVKKLLENICKSIKLKIVIVEIRQKLYDGFTKEEKGRYQYLAHRKLTKPEDKFQYPLLSSWDIGWKVSEQTHLYRNPVHGRSRIVRDTFYKNNGIIYPTSEAAGISTAL